MKFFGPYCDKSINLLLLIVILIPVSSINLRDNYSNENENNLLNDSKSIFNSSINNNLTDSDINNPKTNDQTFSSVSFIKNIGQLYDSSIKYYFHSQNFNFYFKDSSIAVTPAEYELHQNNSFSIGFIGSKSIEPTGINLLLKKTNFYTSQQKFLGVPSYSSIIYKNIYQDIDLLYYGTEKGLKYDFIVHPGGDPKIIEITINQGFAFHYSNNKISFIPENSGNYPSFVDEGLVTYQKDSKLIHSEYIDKSNEFLTSYGFKIDSYDPFQTLIIDPYWVEQNTTLLGNQKQAGGLEMDQNYMYLFGSQNNPSSWTDMFVTKIDLDTNEEIFTTYIGGYDTDRPSYTEHGRGITLDTEGNIYIVGLSDSPNFPVTNDAFQKTLHGGTDIVFVKLNATGNIVYSTYLGGNADDLGRSAAYDKKNSRILVSGVTSSSDFPVLHNYTSNTNGTYNGVIVAFNINGTLTYSTFWGGTDVDNNIHGIKIDSLGNLLLYGHTPSTNFPVTSDAFQSQSNGLDDGWFAKFNIDTNTLLYSTYLGSSFDDRIDDAFIDANDNIYLVGYATAIDIVPLDISNPCVNFASEFVQKMGFIIKFRSSGSVISKCVYFGGNGNDEIHNIFVDSVNNVYVSGYSESTNFITKEGLINYYYDGHSQYRNFLTKFSENFNTILFSTKVYSYCFYEICNYDGGQYFKLTPNKTIIYVSNNWANDGINDNVSLNYVKISNVIDNIKPIIQIQNYSKGKSYSPNESISLEIFDNLSGVKSVYYNWNTTDNITISNPYSIFLPSEEGSFILNVYAFDLAGNLASSFFEINISTIHYEIIAVYAIVFLGIPITVAYVSLRILWRYNLQKREKAEAAKYDWNEYGEYVKEVQKIFKEEDET